MAKARSAWGIDIGQCALKAVKIRDLGGQVQVEAFDIVEHAKILSEPEADRAQLIRTALEQFLSRNSTEGSIVAVAVPGQTGFTRFVKLPPVEAKRIPDIVHFEAEQQIPFPIADVIWRWQTFAEANSPDMEVGIFAMKRVDVAAMLSHFSDVLLGVDVVQMAPLALYNFMRFDDQLADEGATLLADIGADKTDLVVADGAKIWTRTIQIGGNNFTQSLVKAFKLTFRKAEKLKRTAASSKYARQIFQAMRPVFSDLVQEIQRSIGYYTSLHRESRFHKLVGMGNGFRLPGMQKFLEQNLNIEVLRLDNYNKLSTAGGVNAGAFAENVLSFGVSYGLAVQSLGLAPVHTNLLPAEIARTRLWKKKQPWFAAAAVIVLLTLGSMLYSVRADIASLDKTAADLVQAQSHLKQIKGWESAYRGLENEGDVEKEEIRFTFGLLGHRSFWPSVQAVIAQSIQQVTGADQQLLADYISAAGEGDEGFQKQQEILTNIKNKKRDMRRQIFIESMNYEYFADLAQAIPSGAGASADAGQAATGSGYRVSIRGRTPLPKEQANRLIQDFLDATKVVARRYPVVSVRHADYADTNSLVTRGGTGRSGSVTRATRTTRRRGGDDWTRGPEGGPRADWDAGGDWTGGRGNRFARSTTEQDEQVADADPLLPDESMAGDTNFSIVLVLAIEDDGVKLPDQLKPAAE